MTLRTNAETTHQRWISRFWLVLADCNIGGLGCPITASWLGLADNADTDISHLAQPTSVSAVQHLSLTRSCHFSPPASPASPAMASRSQQRKQQAARAKKHPICPRPCLSESESLHDGRGFQCRISTLGRIEASRCPKLGLVRSAGCSFLWSRFYALQAAAPVPGA